MTASSIVIGLIVFAVFVFAARMMFLLSKVSERVLELEIEMNRLERAMYENNLLRISSVLQRIKLLIDKIKSITI